MENNFIEIKRGGVSENMLDRNDYFVVECYTLLEIKDLLASLK
jgi:hypothetical protein